MLADTSLSSGLFISELIKYVQSCLPRIFPFSVGFIAKSKMFQDISYTFYKIDNKINRCFSI